MHDRGNGNANGDSKVFNTERGFGFIVPDDGGLDIFVHVSAIAPGTPLLTEGMRVTFEVGTDRKNGKTKAANVKMVYLGAMTVGIVVQFECHHCGSPYRARQTPRSELLSGIIKCDDCCKTALKWTGHFNFDVWQPTRMMRAKRPMDIPVDTKGRKQPAMKAKK